MAKLNRETLKNYFRSGQQPSEKAFADLIDSMVNIYDDDFSKDEEKMLKVAAQDDQRTVISIFTERKANEAGWNIDVEKNGDLYIRSAEKDSQNAGFLAIRKNNKIEFNASEISLVGHTRQGISGTCPTDGKWYGISEARSGINMYEIRASYMGNNNRYGTILAWASHCGAKKRKIRRMRPRSFFWQNKLQLKWMKVRDDRGNKIQCMLCLRSRYRNSTGIVQYSINHIWNHVANT
jgi:hypothetical protein